MGTKLLEVHPKDLKFTFELKKQSTCAVRLTNKADYDVAFKVKTTSPNKYCVRPNVGVVPAKSTANFTITMQAQKVAPPDMVCKDKFLVQSTIVPPGTMEQDITTSFFAKETGKYVEEVKLRVSLVSPPQSPAVSPIVEDCISEHKPFQTEKLNEKGEESFNGQKFNEAIDTPLKPGKKSGRRGWEIPNDVKLNIKESKPDTAADNHVFAPLHEREAGIIKDAVSDSESATKENPSSLDSDLPELEEAPTDTNSIPKTASSLSGDDIFHQMENANQKSILKASNGQPFMEEESIVKGALLNGTCAPTVPSMIAGDITKMKTQLNSLESKLNEAERTIRTLTEERRLSFQERRALQEELAALKRSSRKKVQSGYPLLFLVMVAIMSTLLGYLSRNEK